MQTHQKTDPAKTLAVWVILLVVAFLSGAAQPAQAGPWLREEGSLFVSLSGEFRAQSITQEGSVYFEYGVSPTLTFGGKYFTRLRLEPQATRGFELIEPEALLFGRVPLGSQDRTWVTALDFGAGLRRSEVRSDTLLRLGFSVGRGLDWGNYGGWFNSDIAGEFVSGPTRSVLKVDTTLGVGLGAQWQAMMQVFVASDLQDNTDVTFAPSFIFKQKDSATSTQFGFESEEGELSGRVSLWFDF